MAISRHNSASGSFSSSSSGSATLTAAIGEIVVLQAAQEKTTGAVATVSSISDGTGNVYAKRFSASQAPTPTFNASQGHEVWWTYVANTLTAASITVTLSGAIDDATILVAGYQGFTGTAYQTNPWDTNASLPATAQSTGTSLPTLSGVSTDSTAGMLLMGMSSVPTNAVPDPPVGFTALTGSPVLNNGAVLAMQGQFADLAYSSAQSAASFTMQGVSANGWIFYVDALTIPAGGGGDTLMPQICLLSRDEHPNLRRTLTGWRRRHSGIIARNRQLLIPGQRGILRAA